MAQTNANIHARTHINQTTLHAHTYTQTHTHTESGPGIGLLSEHPKDDSTWTATNGCTWPRDTAIDHLLICVHGEAMTGASLTQYMQTMRKNSAYIAKKYMEERPMMMAVDAIDWHSVDRNNLDMVRACVLVLVLVCVCVL